VSAKDRKAGNAAECSCRWFHALHPAIQGRWAYWPESIFTSEPEDNTNIGKPYLAAQVIA